jgi:hypothetical protein
MKEHPPAAATISPDESLFGCPRMWSYPLEPDEQAAIDEVIEEYRRQRELEDRREVAAEGAAQPRR